jgi:hypothetical protein
MLEIYIRGYNLSVKERKFYLLVIPEVFQVVISLRVQEVAMSFLVGFCGVL